MVVSTCNSVAPCNTLGPRRPSSRAASTRKSVAPRDTLGLHRPAEEAAPRWLINGFPAIVLVWTHEEFARLEHPPEDAQSYPGGLWVALRMAS